MLWLALFVTGALLIFALTMLLNVFTFPRLKVGDTPKTTPLVSILIPARNEADVIGQTVQHHLAQTYPNFELIVMDDKSDDGTGEIALAAGGDDSRLRVMQGSPVPDGWMGKSWACHNLAQAANGDILVFTDADVQWQADALSALVAQMQDKHVDLFTVWSTQQTETVAERLIVPLMALVILGYLPLVMVNYSPFAVFAAANGQCMAWRRAAYFGVGGHTAVANNVLDDVSLARLSKQHGYRLWMCDGNQLIQARMYRDWSGVRDGFAKNILAGYGNSVIALLAGTVFHWLVFLFPFGMLLIDGYRLWGLLLIVTGIALRALSAAFTHQRVWDAVLMPLSVLLMTRIAAQSLYWHITGGMRWKGRTITEKRKKRVEG